MNLVENLVEVKLKEDDDFLKVRETLTRIGVASKKTNTLFQSCHIFHKQGKYYIVHFKGLFDLDGKPTDFSSEDKQRRNTITTLLSDWGLVEVVKEDKIDDTIPVSRLKIIPHKQKDQWELVAKYNIGKKR